MEQLGYPIDSEIMKENVQKYLGSKNHKAFVAIHSGKIVGCIAMATTHYFHKPACFLRIIALVIDQDYRRLGIGKHLLDIAEKFARQNGCSQIELTSAAHRAELGSHEFYRSRGYLELNNIKKYLAKKLEHLF